VHSSGEMTNPLPLEDVLAADLGTLALRVVVGGQRRPYPVTFVEPADKGAFARGSGGGAVLGAALKRASQGAPAYSRLRRDRVVGKCSLARLQLLLKLTLL